MKVSRISMLPLIALILALSFTAFTIKPTMNKEWRFISEDVNDAKEISAYDDNVGSASCNEGELPCIISVPDLPNSTDEEDLQTYLDGFSTVEAVTAAAEDSREPVAK